MPLHNTALKNKETLERGSGAQTNNSHMMRYQLISYIPIHHLNNLTDTDKHLYEHTWCMNSLFAHIDCDKFVFNYIIADEPLPHAQRAPRPRQPP